MSQQTVKLLLNAADFPFSYFHTPRSATENTDIGPRLPAFFAGNRNNIDFGQPQLIFCENVLPVSKGLVSARFFSQGTQPAGAPVTDFDRHIPVASALTGLYRSMVPARGKNYLYDPGPGVYVSVSPFASPTSYMTSAQVSGRTFVCYSGTRIVEWDEGAGVFNTIALTYPGAMTVADVIGIGAASNYLLFFTDTGIYWCSPLNILDFADIDQGAGSQIPNELVGDIVCIQPISGGAVIYTKACAIAVRFTNNASAPFIFRAIAGANGIGDTDSVATNKAGGYHYTWGAGTIQKITLNSAENVFPALSESLCANYIELWSTGTNSVIQLAASTAVKLRMLNDRYLAISVGTINLFTNIRPLVYIYDSLHERWGKIIAEHVDVYPSTDGGGADSTPVCRLLLKNGDTWVVNQLLSTYPNPTSLTVASRLILGHIQERHDRLVTVQELVLDADRINDATGYPVVSLLGSENGSERSSLTVMDMEVSSDRNQKYTSRVTSQNFDVLIEGIFMLSTALIKVQKHGYR